MTPSFFSLSFSTFEGGGGIVFLVSLSVTMLQIALTRMFSFLLWYHFAYISISLALLGFGSSGSVLAAFPSVGSGDLRKRMGTYAAFASAATMGLLVFVGYVPLEPSDFATSGAEAAEVRRLFADRDVAVLFRRPGLDRGGPRRRPADQSPLLLRPRRRGDRLRCDRVRHRRLRNSARRARRRQLSRPCRDRRRGWRQVGPPAECRVGSLAIALAGIVPRMLPFPASRDKNIAHWLTQGRVEYTRWGSLFRTDVLGGHQGDGYPGDYRYDGVSPHYDGPPATFLAIAHDGGSLGLLYEIRPGMPELQFFRHHILTVPYVLRDHAQVLIVGVGGGADVANALINGAASIEGVELDPVNVELILNEFQDYTDGLFRRPNVRISAGDGRHGTSARHRIALTSSR